VATLPGIPPLRSAVANVRVSAGNIHIDPAILEAGVGGTLRAGGDYNLSSQRLAATLSVDEFPVRALKTTAQTWFGAPAALTSLTDGYVTGQFRYSSEERGDNNVEPAAWSGQFQFSNAILAPPGIAVPLKQAEGRAQFGPSTFDLPHFSATLAQQPVFGSYHYNLAAKRPERLRLELPSASLSQLETALSPALEERGLLARLRFISIDLTEPSDFAAVTNVLRTSTVDIRVFYLACAPNLFGPICDSRVNIRRGPAGPDHARGTFPNTGATHASVA